MIDSEMNACPENPVTISSLSFLTVMARSLHSKLLPDLDILSDSNKPQRVWKNRSTYTFKCALKTFALHHAGFLMKRWPNFTFIHTQLPTSSKKLNKTQHTLERKHKVRTLFILWPFGTLTEIPLWHVKFRVRATKLFFSVCKWSVTKCAV